MEKTTGRPPIWRERVLAALGDKGGLTMVELVEKTGGSKRCFIKLLYDLIKRGVVFRILDKPQSRYYPSQEALDADQPAVMAARIERMASLKNAGKLRTAQADKAKREARRAEKNSMKASASLERGPAVAAPAVRAARPVKACTVVWPEGVKIQVCPSGNDNRFKPEPGHVGEFTAEWQKLRKRGKA